MARPTSLSGFPEWLPEQRIVEQHVLDTLREVFELHGFASIETRSVEPLEQMLRKGEIDKEVYLLRRLQADDGADDSGSRQLGLHFDLTVPLARYVLENAVHHAIGKSIFFEIIRERIRFRMIKVQPAAKSTDPDAPLGILMNG